MSTIVSKILILSVSYFLPIVIFAQEGFVTCSGLDCQFCHLVSTGQNVLNWLVLILTVVAGLLFAYAGLTLVTSGGNRSAQEKARNIFNNVIIGYLIVLAGWLLVDTSLKMLGNQALFAEGGAIGPWNRVVCTNQPRPGDITWDIRTDVGTLDPNYSESAPDIPPQADGQICYPGCGSSGPVCFDAVSAASTGYNYPGGGPSQFIDMDASHPNMGQQIICGYTLSNFNVSNRCGRGGRFVYVDPGAVAGFAQAASALGNPGVNSAFRSPPCNATVGGASRSQHMYGLAFDIQSTNDAATVNACRSAGAGFTQTYAGSNFVHCDWR